MDRSPRPVLRAQKVASMNTALEALNNAGLSFSEIVADGRFHRARKPDDAQWYIANEGTTAAGKPWMHLSAGDFRETGGAYTATVTYKSWDRGVFSRAELKEINASHRESRDRAKQEAAVEQGRARHRAMAIWRKAKPGPHPYLEKKRVPAGNTRVFGRALLIPMYSIGGYFTTLQGVFPDGAKRFLPKGRVAGTYSPISYYFGHEQKVYIAEGWATAAAIAKVQGVPVVAAFSAGNLVCVAEQIREEKPDVQIVIAADSDRFTDGNPGVTFANRAAAAVDGKVIVPDFSRFPEASNPTDWWDYFALTGRI
jgi:putative DNA primase/helicase